MKKIVAATSIFLFALLGCQSVSIPTVLSTQIPTTISASPSPTLVTPTETQTPLPPTQTPIPPTVTATLPPSGISGSVHYTGTKTGGLFVFVSTVAGVPSVVDENSFKRFKDGSGGEFLWSLSTGTYYVAAIVQMEGAPSPYFPFISCGPIEVKDNTLVKIEIALTDETTGGKPRDCGIKVP
jgi:hypothetical protein